MVSVSEIVDKLDERTREALGVRSHEKAIQLYGSRDSRYLKGISAKAKRFWVPVRWYDCPPPLHPDEPFVVDVETIPEEWAIVLPEDKWFDLDRIGQSGLSCTAEACMYILKRLDAVEGKHVCIIGRGHAVQHLAEALLACDATVTVCHSKTRDLLACTYPVDVIVNSAPGTHPLSDVTKSRGGIVLDISGSLAEWKDSNLMTYIGAQEIGRLNTALLLNRFANL